MAAHALASAELREGYLSFFEEKGHKRLPSWPLVPRAGDHTTLLTTAGMQPFKPYFRGEEEPPNRRLTGTDGTLGYGRFWVAWR